MPDISIKCNNSSRTRVNDLTSVTWALSGSSSSITCHSWPSMPWTNKNLLSCDIDVLQLLLLPLPHLTHHLPRLIESLLLLHPPVRACQIVQFCSHIKITKLQFVQVLLIELVTKHKACEVIPVYTIKDLSQKVLSCLAAFIWSTRLDSVTSGCCCCLCLFKGVI